MNYRVTNLIMYILKLNKKFQSLTKMKILFITKIQQESFLDYIRVCISFQNFISKLILLYSNSRHGESFPLQTEKEKTFTSCFRKYSSQISLQLLEHLLYSRQKYFFLISIKTALKSENVRDFLAHFYRVYNFNAIRLITKVSIRAYSV